MSTLDSVYSLNEKVASFAISNEFVTNLSKLCYQMGKNLTPFCFYADEVQKQWGVTDMATYGGFVNPSIRIDEEIANYRADVFKQIGIIIDTSNEDNRKLLFYDYLMSISACYIEVPKYVTKGGMAQHTFDKCLVTKNPSIMGAWMGCSPSEMQAKYSARISAKQLEYSDNNIRYVKLMSSGKGNTITLPRNASNIKDMKCIPLFMLYAYIQGLKTVFSSNIVKFTFEKDNGTLREMPVTISEDILRDYYSDNIYISTMLSGIDIETMQQGGLMLPSKISRGYIKLPEVGASVYDGTGVRSLNVARILRAEIVQDVDRTFIHVDLSSTLENFNNGIEYALKNFEDKIPDIYRGVLGKEPPEGVPILSLATEMATFCSDRVMILSTTFQRQLHLFMVKNPQWFPLYTGKPSGSIVSSQNFGVAQMDF